MMPLGRFRAFESNDPDAVLSIIRRTAVPDARSVTPLASRDFRCMANVFCFGTAGENAIISAFKTNGHLTDAGPMRDIHLLIPETHHLRVSVGRKSREIGGHQAIGLCPSDEHSVEARGTNLQLCVPRSRVQSVMSLLDCDADIGRILNTHFMDPTVKQLDVLGRLVRHTIQSVDDAITGIVDLPAFRAAQDEMLILWVAQVLANAAASGGRSQTCGSSTVVQRCVEFIHARQNEPISLVDLARQANVSLRAVQMSFRKELNCTITEYIRRLRLERAFDMLRAAPPGTSVMEVALRCGFPHLSEFARHYRAAFGELPRDTLRRSKEGRT
jgi:AraC-like DNA-binding protein